ncbi:MAG: ParA family protein [Novosphingobium sp.]
MAVIAVYSVKGGVGKTTIAANLAWCSAAISRRRTLLWDLDPAGGAAFLFGLDANDPDRAAKLFAGKGGPDKAIRPSGFDRLDLLPADESLRGLESQLLALGKRRRLGKIAQALSREYERIILDCPPVLNEVSGQVIRAADLVIVPLPASPLSMRALRQIQDDFAANHKQHPPILPVLSMYDARRRLHKETRAEWPNWPVIPMASLIERMADTKRPAGALAPSSPQAQSFARLWTAVERKLAKG